MEEDERIMARNGEMQKPQGTPVSRMWKDLKEQGRPGHPQKEDARRVKVEVLLGYIPNNTIFRSISHKPNSIFTQTELNFIKAKFNFNNMKVALLIG